jgi:hypothetical protein
MMEKARPDLITGAVFVAFGLAFAVGALADLRIGTPSEMGPGWFPLALGVVLVVLGLMVAGEGFLASEARRIGRPPWRAALLIVGALLFFGLTVRGLGLLPALFGAVLLGALAARQRRTLVVVAIAVGLTALSILIFVVALRLPLSLFGTWLAF